MNMIRLFNGVHMPQIGIGTYQIRDKDVIFKILDAGLATGYRLIDTAAGYGNEQYIAKALKVLLPKYGLSREQIFITSKLAPKDHGKENARQASVKSLENLEQEYIDLYLIHWPGVQKMPVNDTRNRQLRLESWIEIERLYECGKFRAIGVSNYNISHLNNLLETCQVPPMVNQCEFHPHYFNTELVNFCMDRKIHFQAYSSLGGPTHKDKLLNEALLQTLASKYKRTVSQILLAWAMKQKISVLPRSSNPERVIENYSSVVVNLSEEDFTSISKLSETTYQKYCWDPKDIM